MNINFMATGEQYQLTFAEQQNKKDEEIQDSLQEGKIEASEEIKKEQNKKISIFHNTTEIQNRLAKLKNQNLTNDKSAFINHEAIKHISGNIFNITVQNQDGIIHKEKVYLNTDNNTFVNTANGTSTTAPKYIFGLSRNNQRLIALTHIKESGILLFIENGRIYQKLKNGQNKTIQKNEQITGMRNGKYVFQMVNKNGIQQIAYSVIKPAEESHYYSANNTTPYSIETPYAPTSDSLEIQQHTETLNEQLDSLSEGKIRSHQYEIEQLLQQNGKNKTEALAKIFNIDLTKIDKKKFAKHVQKAIGLTGKGATGIDGVIGNYTLKKIWERKLNDELTGSAETIRQEILTAVNSFSENKSGDKEKFTKQLHYTARYVKENSTEAKNILKYARIAGTKKRIDYVLKSLDNGGNAAILDSQTSNLYIVNKNNKNKLQITMAVKVAVGKNGFAKIGDKNIPDFAALKNLMSKKDINKTPKGFHTFYSNNRRGFKKTGLDRIVDNKHREKGEQYDGKKFMESITTPQGKKPSMITGSQQIMGPIHLHGSDAWSRRITPKYKNYHSNGCVNLSPADMALVMSKNLKSILIV